LLVQTTNNKKQWHAKSEKGEYFSGWHALRYMQTANKDLSVMGFISRAFGMVQITATLNCIEIMLKYIQLSEYYFLFSRMFCNEYTASQKTSHL